MSNVHQLGAVKCPPGSKAIHKDFGWCEVLAADGLKRTVMYEAHLPDETPNIADLPEGVTPGEVLFSETIEQITEVIDVRDLREVNPKKDMIARPKGTTTALFCAQTTP